MRGRRLTIQERRRLRSKGLNKNVAEQAAQIIFQSKGISVRRRGYPDFTILKGDDIFGFIEVKPNVAKELKVDQKRFGRFCKEHDIPFMRWSPEDGQSAIERFMDQ